MDYITTYTGIRFVPTKPCEKDIKIEDIAHALSLICRGNGHVKHFFSVAQHSINCALEAKARGYEKRVQMGCLLHDASEAYLSDITRPVKKYLPEYLKFEEQLQTMIDRKYISKPLTKSDYDQIRGVDDDMLYYELEALLKETQTGMPPVMSSQLRICVSPFEKVEQEFLALFEYL